MPYEYAISFVKSELCGLLTMTCGVRVPVLVRQKECTCFT